MRLLSLFYPAMMKRNDAGINNSCAEGFTGPLCLQCDNKNDYVMNSQGKCEKCDVKGSTYIHI